MMMHDEGTGAVWGLLAFLGWWSHLASLCFRLHFPLLCVESSSASLSKRLGMARRLTQITEESSQPLKSPSPLTQSHGRRPLV